VDWSEAVAVRPDVAEFRYQRALRLVREKRFEDARADIEQTLRLAPDHAPALAVLGLLHKVQGDTARMLGAWEKAIALEPELVGVHEQLAQWWMASGQPRRAVACLERALAVDPSATALYTRIGAAYAACGEHARAISWQRRATRYSPENPAAWDNLGLALLGVDDLAGARRAFEKSLAAGESASARIHLAITWADLGERERAMAELRRAVAINGDNAEAAFYLGQLLSDAGRGAEAVEWWRQAARAGSPGARQRLREANTGW
jgi:tetratricopeptide (TPR) repeat protein